MTEEVSIDMAQIRMAEQLVNLLREADFIMKKLSPGTKQTTYLTTEDIQNRWQCSYSAANAFMHRKGSGAIKPSKRLLIPEKEVIAYENMHKVRM